MKKLVILFLIIGLLSSCDKNPKVVDEAEEMSLDIEVNRLEQDLLAIDSKEQAEGFLESNRAFVTDYLEAGFPLEDRNTESFFRMMTSQSLRDFIAANKEKYQDFETKEKEKLVRMFKYIRYYYPDFRVPEVNTLVSGFKFPEMKVTDSTVFISLDYFNKDSEYRPPLYEYMLERYKRPYIPVFLAQTIAGKYNNHNPEDKTMLAEMIYFGKMHYFTERILPELPDSMNIMYNSETMTEVRNNTDVIWAHFIKNEWFYKKDRRTKQKICGEAPKVAMIGEKCPGRIGRYLGWQIVRAYMEENPDVTLQELMAEQDARKIFEESNYKPQIKS